MYIRPCASADSTTGARSQAELKVQRCSRGRIHIDTFSTEKKRKKGGNRTKQKGLGPAYVKVPLWFVTALIMCGTMFHHIFATPPWQYHTVSTYAAQLAQHRLNLPRPNSTQLSQLSPA